MQQRAGHVRELLGEESSEPLRLRVYLLRHAIRRDRPALQWVAVAVFVVLIVLLAVLHWLSTASPPQDDGNSYLERQALTSLAFA